MIKIRVFIENKGRILACDIYDHKLERVRENAERLGIEIIEADLFSGEQKIIKKKKKNNKDKGQRQFCGCIASKDIGEYNTCAHLCEYCYANSSKEAALHNLMTHRNNPFAETITGK